MQLQLREHGQPGLCHNPTHRADFEQWGLSEGCPGCRYLRTGQGRQQAHSEACRKRIEGLLKGDSMGAATTGCGCDERINRALPDAVERHAAKDHWSERHSEEGQCHLSSRIRIPKEVCTGHRAGIDTTPLSLAWRIIRIRHTTQHRHKDCTGY